MANITPFSVLPGHRQPYSSLLPTCVSFPATTASALVRSCTGARSAEMGPWCGRGHVLKWSWKASQSAGLFQSASSTLLLGVSKHMCTVHEWNLVPYSPLLSHCFSNPQSELIFPVLDARAVVSNIWFKKLAH